MFRSVLVPLDGTPYSEQAMPLAELVGRVAGTQLHLVSVEEDGAGASDKDKEVYLTRIVQRLRGAGIEADYLMLDGKVVDAIEDRAKQVDANLIVMVTHGRSGLERLRFGSVAEGLVSRGVAPMLLFHPGPDGPSSVPKAIDRVVVAFDFSSFAERILDPLGSLGKAVGVSSYTFVHVVDGTGVGKSGWSPRSSVLTSAQERIAPFRERLGGADVDIRVITASDPSDGILGVAEETGADLIAMTTHGMTGVRSTVVGSVAAQVLRKWNGALLVQRPASD